MKKYLLIIFCLIIVFFVSAGASDEYSLPVEDVLKSMLPSVWTVKNVSKKSVPVIWNGPAECAYYEIENPQEVYKEPFGHFEYNESFSFWFCPATWQGTCNSPNCEGVATGLQEYPARFLCKTEEYQIYYLTLGENSQEGFVQRVQKKFCQK